MLEKEFERLYLKFRSNYCTNLFAGVDDKSGGLTATESYCVEVIYLLNRPTVHEFADYIKISLPNATYRISNLVRKGYIKKEASEKDKREYYLEVTRKFLDHYGANATFNANLMKKVKEKFTQEEVNLLESMLRKMVDEIME